MPVVIADSILVSPLLVTRLPEVPQNTVSGTVIEQDQILLRQAVSPRDVLNVTPGLAVSRSGAFGGLTSVRQRGASSDKTLLLLDGVPLNDPSQPNGGADLGLSYVDDLPDAVEGIALQRETFSVVVPKRHRLAARRSLALAELKDEPMVALPSDSRTRRTIDAAASTAGLSLRQVVTVGQFATLMGCVRAGVGLAVVPTGATGFFLGRDLRAIPVSEPRLSRRLGLITLREREPSPAAAGFMALVRRTWPKPGRI